MNIEKEIKALQEQLDSLKAKQSEECKSKGIWKPQKGDTYYYVESNGSIDYCLFEDDASDRSTNNFGNCYKTLKQAKQARDAMRKHNRILAWLSNHGDGWVADWTNNSTKWYVYYDSLNKEYQISWTAYHKYQSVVYMSEQNATELTRQLNEGEFTL